jgi:hypothetical protein
MKYNPIYPKSEDIYNLMDNLSKINSPYAKTIRIKPKTAQNFGRYSVIRKLTKMDYIDIANCSSGKKHSILYIHPCLKIEKYKNGFILKPKL